MVAKSNFLRDLAFGEEAEYMMLEKLHTKYPKAYKVEGKEIRWDIIVPEIDKSVEVKYDARAAGTGNFFIESSCNSKPSGIEATEADYWAIYTGEQWYYTTPELIKHCIADNDIKTRRFRIVEGFIVPIENMKDYTLNSITTEQ